MRRLAGMPLRPFRSLLARLSGLRRYVAPVGREELRYRAGYARSTVATGVRKLRRAAIVLAGLVIFVIIELGIAGEIAALRWWFILAIFIAVSAAVGALARPMHALVGWLVVSPIAIHLFKLDWGAGVPAVTFDRTVLYLLALAALGRALINRVPLRKPHLPEFLLLAFPIYILCTGPFFPSESNAQFLAILFTRAGDLCILYVVATSSITKKQHIIWVLAALVFVGCYSTAMGFYDHFTGKMSLAALIGVRASLIYADVDRAAGPFFSPTHLGIMLGMSIVLVIYLAPLIRSIQLRVLFYALVPAMLLSWFWTYTRGGYILLALALALMPVLAGWSRKRYVAMTSAGGILVILLVSGALSSKETEHRLTNVRTVTDRIVSGAALINTIRHNPWFGVGLGNGSKEMIKYVTSVGDVAGLNIWQGIGNYAERYKLPFHTASHSTYLTVLADHGIVGGALFVGSILGFLIVMWRTRNVLPVNGALGRDLPALVCCMLIGCIISMNTSSIEPGEYIIFAMWSLIACVMRLGILQSQEAESQSVSAEPARLPAMQGTWSRQIG